MKFSNPFDRRKNVDSVPFSVFPASKRVRSSCQIGRAVPVYINDMVQGNHIKLSASDAIRFMTMNRPVMNDFECTFGAYFVPYVALDECTNSKIALREDPDLAATAVDYGLNARDFFNPATPDSRRVHPISLKFTNIADYAKSGSLYEHLGYSINADITISTYKKYVTNASPVVALSDVFAVSAQVVNNSTSGALEFKNIYTHLSLTLSNGSNIPAYFPFDIWVMKESGLINDITLPSSLPSGTTTWAQYFNSQTPAVKDSLISAHSQVVKFLFSDGDSLPNFRTLDSAYSGFLAYLNSAARVSQGTAFTANVVRWLAYNRIYADYFLNELYVEHDDYLAAITHCYLTQCVNPTSTVYGTITNVIQNVYANHPLRFFLEYLRKGECLPVRWQLDPLTAMQNVEANGGNVTIADGDSIPTLFYKRMVQKFRDLVARMGNDYKDNTKALYGSRIPDSTLQRSQCIGLKSFDVKISAIAQTSADSTQGSTGDFSGVGYSAGKTDSWEWTAEENGLIMVLMWIRPKDVAYVGQVDRSIIKSKYTDYLLPQFGGVGYQDVPMSLVQPSSNAATLSQVIGIQERYFEYMMLNNEVSGAFLDFARPYSVDRKVTNDWRALYQNKSAQAMIPLYITEYDDINHIFTDTTHDPVLFDIKFEGTVTRQLPAYMRTDF